MEFINQIIDNLWVQRVFWALVVIIASVIIYQIAKRVLATHEKRKNKFLSNKKNKTFTRMLRSIIRYILIIADALIILQIFGVDISSMLAAAGIASVVIAFAVKDALQDIVRGFDIISDNYYNVGDIVKIGTVEGKVLAVGLKTTKIEDINTKNTVSIANRNVVEVEILSDMIDIDVPLPYELPLKDAEKVLAEAVQNLEQQDLIKTAEYRKVSDFADSSMNYRIKVYGDPALRPQVRRDALHTIATTLSQHHISIPYPHLDLKTSK